MLRLLLLADCRLTRAMLMENLNYGCVAAQLRL